MTPRRSRRCSAVALALVAVVAFGACGGGGDDEQPAKTVENGEITIDAFDIHFDVGDIKTEAGPLKITLVNKGALEHTIRIKEKDFELKAKAGETVSGTVDLEPGTYEYDCTIAGHAAQGMKGEIQVS
jgi:plastocyanin